MVVLSVPLSFAGNPNFVNTLPLYTFNIQFMYDNFIFFVFNIKQIASIFCNVSFAGQYILPFQIVFPVRTWAFAHQNFRVAVNVERSI